MTRKQSHWLALYHVTNGSHSDWLGPVSREDWQPQQLAGPWTTYHVERKEIRPGPGPSNRQQEHQKPAQPLEKLRKIVSYRYFVKPGNGSGASRIRIIWRRRIRKKLRICRFDEKKNSASDYHGNTVLFTFNQNYRLLNYRMIVN